MVIKQWYDSESFFVSLIKWFFVLKNSMGSICKGIKTITSLLRIPSACSSLIARLQRKKSVKTFQSQLEVQRIGVGTGSPSPPFLGGKVRHNIGIDNWGFFIGLVPLPYSPGVRHQRVHSMFHLHILQKYRIRTFKRKYHLG